MFEVQNNVVQLDSIASAGSVSLADPKLKYTVFDSKRGKKTYESTYPK